MGSRVRARLGSRQGSSRRGATPGAASSGRFSSDPCTGTRSPIWTLRAPVRPPSLRTCSTWLTRRARTRTPLCGTPCRGSSPPR
eukprot:555372-Alexandrium_andersonii.AAC.1